MRIAIDAHTVGTQLAGNVTYITSMIEALAEIDRTNEYTLYVTRPDAFELYENRWPNFAVRRILHQTRVFRILFSFNTQLRLHPADIFFVQFNAPPFAPCKVVTAIHDLSYEHLPETFTRLARARMQLTIRRTAKNSAHIVTCSEYSRQDLIATYDLAPEKVTMIPLAAASIYKQVTDADEIIRMREKYDLSGDFILGVGSIQPRKNLVRLIEAYSALVKRRDDVPPLVLVGKNAWLFEETINAVKENGVRDRVRFTGFVPEEDLPALYTAALCFVYPSFFEGFGLPPLEAMHCGTPVITGDRTSLPEVVGDAALLVDPFNTRAISSALEQMIADNALRERLSKLGFERAKQFSWLRAARQTLNVFEGV